MPPSHRAAAPDFIKVDMSTIRDISAHPPRLALVSSFLGFAADIGATVVSDGVETEPEIEMLRGPGIDHAQGDYLARPGQIPDPGCRRGRIRLGSDDPTTTEH